MSLVVKLVAFFLTTAKTIPSSLKCMTLLIPNMAAKLIRIFVPLLRTDLRFLLDIRDLQMRGAKTWIQSSTELSAGVTGVCKRRQ